MFNNACLLTLSECLIYITDKTIFFTKLSEIESHWFFLADFFKKGGSPVNSAAWVRIWQEQNNYFLQSNKEYTVFSLEYGISNIFEMICKPLGKKT